MGSRNISGSKLKKICIIISISFIITQIISTIHLTRIFPSTIPSKIPIFNDSRSSNIDEFGRIVIEMLPKDLVFTLFLPSKEAFRRDLRLNGNDSNTYAILTRVLGFSAVPRWITMADLECGKQKIYDSISGFSLYLSKDLNEMAVVNGVVSEEVDLKIGKILVHVMNGVVMDAEFEQSVQREDAEEERR